MADRKKKQDSVRVPRTEERQHRSASQTALHGAGSLIKLIFGIMGTLLLVVLCTGIIFSVLFANYLQHDVLTQSNYSLDGISLNQTSYVYYEDKSDGQWKQLQRLYSTENRIWADHDEIPETLVNAAIAIEDKRFYQHQGVDWKRTISASLNLFVGNDAFGGSTITQQLIKNLSSDDDITVRRKLLEIFRALEFEKKYTKDEIMTWYLNTIYLGEGCYGVKSAANVYFAKGLDELTVAECATIVGTTKNPYAYDPFTHWEENQERKEYILGLMLEQGKLTKEEYNAAMAQEIVLATGTNSNATIQTWFVDYVTDEVCRDLAEKQGITEAEAYQNLIGGGYRIYTTCEERVQEILEDYYSSPDNFPPVNNEEYPQSACVITDTNGALKGIVGGNRGKEGNRIWNRASDTTRQIGSTIKTITSYVLGIEKDLITYSTVIEDRQVVINPDEVSYSQPLWVPKNEYNSFKGFVTVRTALIRSINTVAVQITQKLGTTTSYDFLKYSLNVDTLTAGDNSYSPMALGSLSKGMTLVKLAGAYQMFGNGGVRTEPYSYTRVEDTYGNVILEKNTVPVRVISAETATVMNRLLQEVTGWEGTGAAANLGGMNIPVAGKTGTTDDSVDQWFVGVTPYYVGVCWLGYDSRYKTDEAGNIQYNKYGVAIPNSIRYSSYPPPKIWKAIMSQVHEGASGQSFETSNNVTSYQYCKLTGMLAGPGCSDTATGWYKNSNIPQVCSYHNYGSSYGVPLVGMTAAECGVEYADWYLNVAWSLIQQYKAQGQRLSVKDAIEMAKSGTVAYNEPAYGPFESIFAGMP